jgi:hypothetical protein
MRVSEAADGEDAVRRAGVRAALSEATSHFGRTTYGRTAVGCTGPPPYGEATPADLSTSILAPLGAGEANPLNLAAQTARLAGRRRPG